MVGEGRTKWLPTSLSASLLAEAAISGQSTGPAYLEDRVLLPVVPPANCPSCSWKPECLPALRWGSKDG